MKHCYLLLLDGGACGDKDQVIGVYSAKDLALEALSTKFSDCATRHRVIEVPMDQEISRFWNCETVAKAKYRA